MCGITIALPRQTSYAIHTEQQALIDLFRLKHGHYVIPYDDAVPNHIFVKKHASSFVVYFETYTEITDSPFDAIERLMHEHRQYDDTVLALHGAAIEHNGKASVFLASTGSGKTTLTAYLTACGFSYITDDCVLLDRGSLHVHPCTTPIHLRDGGIEVLSQCNALPRDLRILETAITRRHVFTPPNTVTTSLPLGAIYFISRANHNTLRSMSTSDKIAALMKAPITEYALSGTYITFLSHLAQLPCYTLYYKDLPFVAEVLSHE